MIYRFFVLFMISTFMTVVSCNKKEKSSENIDPSIEKKHGEQTENEKKSKRNKRLRNVRIETMKQETINENFMFETNINAEHDVVLTAKSGGEILEHNFEIGSVIKKGSTLVVIDPAESKNQLRQAEIKKKQAELTYELQKKIFNRDKKLYEHENLSREIFEQSENALANSKLAYEQSVAALDHAETRYGYSFLKAPFTGEIAETLAFKGQTVSAGMPVARLVDTRRLKVIIGLTDEDLIKYRKNRSENVYIILPDKSRAKGYVSGISNAPDRDNSLYSMKINFRKKPGENIFPGMHVKVAVPGAFHENAFRVERNTLVMRNGEHFLFIEKNGKALRKKVSVLARNSGEIIVRFAEKHLHEKPSFNVIVSGHQSLMDGQSVKVID